MENDWKYIDEFDCMPDVPAAYCDTRDFHILCVSDEQYKNSSIISPISMIKPSDDIIEDYLYAREEILGWLKSLEMGSGGKCKWRFLSFDMSGETRYCMDISWIKYIRFYRIEYKGQQCYFAYTIQGSKYYPLKRKVFIQENIITDDNIV